MHSRGPAAIGPQDCGGKGGQGTPRGLRPYLQDKPIRAGAVILVHLVDDQEDDTGEEGQGKENQHRDLWEEAEDTMGLRNGDRQAESSGHRHEKASLMATWLPGNLDP